MAQQTLKRQIEDVNSVNDNLNNEDFDVTWGGKRSRYIYNYTLELPDSNSDTYDSDQTESVLSIQSKSTMEVVSEIDLSSSDSCGSNCCCKNSNNTEFELVSSSSSSSENQSSSSESATIVDNEIPNVPSDNTKKTSGSDNGYIADDTDIICNTVSTPISKSSIPPPACFRTCVQCSKLNPNPYFQYCHQCFRYRMEFVVNKPKAKPKGVKRLNKLHRKKEYNLFKASQGTSNSEQPVSSLPEGGRNENLCNICLIMPKNGVFNHGKIGHIYCCYPCAKQLRRKSDKCPICNLKVRFITKLITV